MRLKEDRADSCVKEEFRLTGRALPEMIQAVLEEGKFFRFQVRGFSMSPFIKDGDILTLSKFSRPPGGLLGMPVAYISIASGQFMIHRIIKAGRGYCLIKGDNAQKPDCLIEEASLLGYVTKIERSNKIIRFSLGRERVIIAFLSRAGLLPMALYFWRLIPFSLRRFIKCRII